MAIVRRALPSHGGDVTLRVSRAVSSQFRHQESRPWVRVLPPRVGPPLLRLRPCGGRTRAKLISQVASIKQRYTRDAAGRQQQPCPALILRAIAWKAMVGTANRIPLGFTAPTSPAL